MSKHGMLWVLAALVTVCLFQPAWAQRPQANKIEFTTENVEKAIEKGCTWLLSQQQADGSWPAFISGGGKVIKLGPTGLAVYSLIASGVPAKDPKVLKALEWLAANDPAPTEKETLFTYDKAFACLAYFAANKQLQKKYFKQLESDVKTLYISNDAGKYEYNVANVPNKSGYYDNSNSQYGLYGVWTGARAGLEIPKSFWETCLKHWIGEQQADGGWKYNSRQERGSYPHMTVAGLASLFVCIDYLMADKFIKCETANEYAPIKKGLDWMEKNFAESLNPKMGDFHYYLYGVERVGLASGYKYFGSADWYREGAAILLNTQNADGSWSVGHLNRRQDCQLSRNFDSTGYALLFLARGRLPVILNRLEYDGDWNNRPRALANFCKWGEGVYETEVNWQIVTLKSAVEEWHDAPIIVVTGSKAPKFSEEDAVKLRTYVNQGGTIMGITECNGGVFGKGMRDLYAKLFPKYELAACGRDHILNTIQYKLPPAIRMYEVSNGIRPLIIHTDMDIPLAWQRYQVATAKPSFEAAGNVIMYVTDRQLKNRGTTVWPAEPAKAAAKTVKAVRIRYAGNYDPEPLALQRLNRLLWKLYDVRLDYESALSPASAPAGGAKTGTASTGLSLTELTNDIKLAFLTGTNAIKLSAEEKAALNKWVVDGGLLVIDAGGGAKAFADSARDLIAEIWGADSLVPLPVSSPIYQMKDMTVDKVKYRRVTRARLGGIKEPHLMAVLAGDKLRVIFSAEDLTGALVGYASYGCDGYETESAFDLLRNIVLFAAAGK